MAATIEEFPPRSLADADLQPRGRVFPSPISWRDQILYQLLPDRFSDGREMARPMGDRTQPEQFRASSKAAWMTAGNKFNDVDGDGRLSKTEVIAMIQDFLYSSDPGNPANYMFGPI